MPTSPWCLTTLTCQTLSYQQPGIQDHQSVEATGDHPQVHQQGAHRIIGNAVRCR